MKYRITIVQTRADHSTSHGIGNVVGDGLSNMTKSMEMVVTSSDSAGDMLI